MWQHTPVIPALLVAEAGGSRAQIQPVQFSNQQDLVSKENNKTEDVVQCKGPAFNFQSRAERGCYKQPERDDGEIRITGIK